MSTIFQKIKCLISLHDMEVASVRHYYDTSFMNYRAIARGVKGAPSTRATFICRCCRHVKVKSYYNAGFLDANQLRKQQATSNRPPDQPKYW